MTKQTKNKLPQTFLYQAQIIATCLALSLISCNFTEEKSEPTPSDDIAKTETLNSITFAEINSKILEPYCTSCHSEAGGNVDGVNLETYSAVKSQIRAIKSSTVDSTRMPKGDKLSSSLIQLLGKWIEQGAPETAQ